MHNHIIFGFSYLRLLLQIQILNQKKKLTVFIYNFNTPKIKVNQIPPPLCMRERSFFPCESWGKIHNVANDKGKAAFWQVFSTFMLWGDCKTPKTHTSLLLLTPLHPISPKLCKCTYPLFQLSTLAALKPAKLQS